MLDPMASFFFIAHVLKSLKMHAQLCSEGRHLVFDLSLYILVYL